MKMDLSKLKSKQPTVKKKVSELTALIDMTINIKMRLFYG